MKLCELRNFDMKNLYLRIYRQFKVKYGRKRQIHIVWGHFLYKVTRGKSEFQNFEKIGFLAWGLGPPKKVRIESVPYCK